MLTRSRGTREGFTLLEVLFVLVLFGIVGAATMQVIVRQQRYYASANEMMAMRTNLRDAASVLPADLRGISSSGGDIVAMSDSAIDFRQPTGQAIVCSIGAGRTTLVIPPPVLASRSAVTSWLAAPLSGDQAFVYAEGATSMIADDTWQLVTLAAAPIAGVCPTTSGYTSTATEQAAALTLTVAPALQADVAVGSIIRFTHRAKYKLFQPTAGGAWYLGYLDCPGGVCGTLQAVAGPYMPYSAVTSSTGLRFVYRDSTGAITNTPANVARIDITARAQTQNPIRVPGRPLANYGDSIVVTIALRNRS
jgi:prepilin-type N-terminal cleavage/methylation domain-containing protein